MVSFANTVSVELDYCQSAFKHKHLRKQHRLHGAAGAVGMGCFYLEEVNPEMPYVHGCWHLLSAVSLVTYNAFIDHCEAR